jgi:hypothetical protein
MAWHFTAPGAAIHLNVSAEIEVRLGARGRLHVLALAWDDAAGDPRSSDDPPAGLRYLVWGQGMAQPAWVEPPEAISVGLG